MINRYKSKEGGTMIPMRFQTGGSNLFLTMPNGGNVGPMGSSPMGLPEYRTGANYGYPFMQEGGGADMDGDDQSFYSGRMNTFIQKIRDAAEKNLETAIMEQDQQQPMAAYGMSMGSDPMNSYDPGNLGIFAKTADFMKNAGQGALSGYIQRMGALGPNDYYYKEKNIYKDKSKGAPLGTQTFTDADGNQSSISPEEAYNRANYALYTKKHGGGLLRAKDGLTGVFAGVMDPELYRRALEMGHESIEDYQKSGWGYGKKHPQYKAPSYPSRVRINDPRTINATSGNPINPNVDLKSGDYHTGVIGDIARAAREYGVDPQELIAMGLQETNLGKTDPNYGHVLNYQDPANRGAAYDMAFAKTQKNKLADEKGYSNDEVRRIQTYNGLGTVYPWTELDYHGFPMKSIYGVPLTNAGINMVENPLYGKRIMDLRDNVLKNPKNAEYNQFLDKYNRDLANEEAVSQQQLGMYDIFNTFGPQYGNQFRDMLQGAYNDSINNSLNSEYIYPDGDLNLGYSVPNLDNTRQRNALDRFNQGIGYEQIPYRNGGALKKFTGDEDGSTTGDNYWSADEKAYLDALPKAQRDAIISKGDKGREAYTAYRTANDKPKASQQSTTANNTGNNTANNTTTQQKTVTNGPEVIGGNGDPNMLYNGHNSSNENTTVINGVRYAVDPVTREVLGYNPQSSARTQNYDNYNPYGAYNPYGEYGRMRGRNLGVISKNRLTPEFRENMLAGSYDNPQLLGVSEIKTRRAMDPGNRVKSITYSYGQPIPGGRTTINKSQPNSSTQTNSGSSSTTPGNANNPTPGSSSSTTPNTSVNPSVSTLTPEQKIQQAMDFTFRPGQGPYSTPIDFPGLEKPKVGPWADYGDDQPVPNVPGAIPNVPTVTNNNTGYTPPAFDMNRSFGQISNNELNYFSTEGDMSNPDWRSQRIDNYGSTQYGSAKQVGDKWNNIKGKPVNDDNDIGRKGLTKDQVAKEYDKVPAPLKDIAMDHLFNASSDPRIFTLAAAGAIEMNDSLMYKDNPKLLEDAWAKNIDLINQQYKDDPQAFTSAVNDYRKIIYRKSRQKGKDQYGNDIDTKSTTGQPGLQYNAWEGRTSNTGDYLDRTYFNPANGYTAPQYFKKHGGALNKFIRRYDDGGPLSVRDMSVADMPTTDEISMDEINQILGEDAFKPFEMTDADRIRAVDKGTEYEQLEPGDLEGIAPAFDVTTKRKKKRIGNPEKDLAAINLATKFFKGRDAAYAETELRNRSQASQVFNPIRSTEGNYDILSGDFRRGKRAADGNDAFHSGFGTYAQMGGNMLQNLKEGDEVYLTEDQINDILKRGGKLSYL